MVLNTILEKGLFTEWILAALEKPFLKQVIMAAHSIDPVEISQLDLRWEKYLDNPIPFLQMYELWLRDWKCYSCRKGVD